MTSRGSKSIFTVLLMVGSVLLGGVALEQHDLWFGPPLTEWNDAIVCGTETAPCYLPVTPSLTVCDGPDALEPRIGCANVSVHQFRLLEAAGSAKNMNEKIFRAI